MPGDNEMLCEEDAEIAQLLQDIGSGQLSRRQILRRGVALGLTIPAIGWLLAARESSVSTPDLSDIWSSAAAG